MIIGVVSDSHEELSPIIESIVEISTHRAEYYIHLGDFYKDCEMVNFPDALKIVRVPGIYSDIYQDPGVPNRRVEIFDGMRFLLMHAPESTEKDLPGDKSPAEIIENENIDIVLYGHTHIPSIEDRNGVIWFNPGHLIYYDKRGYPPSYGIINTVKQKYAIYGLRDSSIIKKWPMNS